jgi:S-adenosyl methyltransferase
VLVHARALLTSSPQGATSYIEADLRDPDKILDGAAATLDFEELAALDPTATAAGRARHAAPVGRWSAPPRRGC